MQNVFRLMVPEGEMNITMGKAQQHHQEAERSHLHHASEAEREPEVGYSYKHLNPPSMTYFL